MCALIGPLLSYWARNLHKIWKHHYLQLAQMVRFHLSKWYITIIVTQWNKGHFWSIARRWSLELNTSWICPISPEGIIEFRFREALGLCPGFATQLWVGVMISWYLSKFQNVFSKQPNIFVQIPKHTYLSKFPNVFVQRIPAGFATQFWVSESAVH